MLHRLVRIAGGVTRSAFEALVKTLVTFLIFGLGVIVTMRYLGLPVPSPSDLLHSVEGLSKLAKILG
ncbi:MAG TPA: hypothetical protein VKB46_26195 [Pyrinomonadaceae bacterium]|nr:hypothetical protein [Pyrinomonadaceae bacterium]